MKHGSEKSTKALLKDMGAKSPEVKSGKKPNPDSARKSMKGFLRGENDSSRDQPAASPQDPKDLMRAFTGSGDQPAGGQSPPGGSPSLSKSGKKSKKGAGGASKGMDKDKDAWKRAQPVVKASPAARQREKDMLRRAAFGEADTSAPGSAPSGDLPPWLALLDSVLDPLILLLKLLILLSVGFYLFLLIMQPHEKAVFGSLVLERFVAFVHNTFSTTQLV